MLTPVSGVANTNGEITPQILRLCVSFGSCHENQHSNENRKFARISTDFDNDLFSENIKRILLLSKKCDGQVRDEQISVPVISTIVAMLLGTNSGVALQ